MARTDPLTVSLSQSREALTNWLADTGDYSAEEVALIGRNFLYGYTYPTGWAQHEEPAFQVLQKAAHMGHPEAMSDLAFCYGGGYGTPVSDYLAFVWYHRCSEQTDCLESAEEARKTVQAMLDSERESYAGIEALDE
jgi:hypothetical protein